MSEEKELYYGIQVTKDVSEDGEIFIHAHKVELIHDALCFYDKHNDYKLCITKGKWLTFYYASVIDGHPCGVEHWKRMKISNEYK